MMSLQLGLPNKAAREKQRIPHPLCSNNHNTPHLGDELGWRVGDRLMSEHVLRRGGMREPEIPFEMMSRVLLLGRHDLVSPKIRIKDPLSVSPR